MLTFTPIVKILCNFGTPTETKEKNGYKIPLLGRARCGLEDVKQQKVRSNI